MSQYMNRTLGWELEFGGVKREEVDLPEGYGWSPNEKNIVNPTATRATPSGIIGGEVNTRPLSYTEADLSELKGVIDQCFAADGRLMWNTGFDGHLYIGDLDLEEIKRVTLLGMYMSPYMFELFDLGDWLDMPHMVPRPQYSFIPRIRNASSFTSFGDVLANSSNKGHYRFPINVMSLFVTKTLEFRVFNATSNFDEIRTCIDFMYSYMKFALENTEDDFKKLETIGDAKEALNIIGDMPTKTRPCIFAGPQDVITTSIAKHIRLNSRHVHIIRKLTKKSIYLLTPANFEIALKLYKDYDVTVCARSEYTDVLCRLAAGELDITYTGEFKFLNKYKGKSVSKHVALFFVFAKLYKYQLATDYGRKEFDAYKVMIKDSLLKLEEYSTALVDMIDHITYKYEEQNGIINKLGKDDTVVFNQVEPVKYSSIIASLGKNSDYEVQNNKILTDYLKLTDTCNKRNINLLVFSMNRSMGLHKVSVDGKVYTYSNRKGHVGDRIVLDKTPAPRVKIPADDYRVADQSDISINMVKPSYLLQLQETYVHKVIKVKAARFAFVVTDKDMILGGFGFDYDKSDDMGLILLSDFCTNNNAKLLSKLILFLIKTKKVQTALERTMGIRLKESHTFVYTNRPVSMKYRGAFKKGTSPKPNCLVYSFDFGSVENIDRAVIEYRKRLKSSGKNNN